MTDTAQWRTPDIYQILVGMLDDCRKASRMSLKEGEIIVKAEQDIKALLATVQAETDRESRISELRRMDPSWTNKRLEEFLGTRLTVLNQKAGRDGKRRRA